MFPRRVLGVIALCTAVAAFLRFYQLTRPGYLLGVTEYDDGVNFGNALRLVSGVIPYRDFVMVQPPGAMVLIAPVALLAKVTGTAAGMGLARLLTAAADTACVALLGLLVRHRGVLAAGLASGSYAVYPDALVAAHTFMLEPWLNLCCLTGALLLFDGDRFTASGRRVALGGVAFGFAMAIKVWAVVPFALICLLTLTRPRRLATLCAGGAAGLAVPVLPFLVMAPSGLIQDVITSQFVRSNLMHHAPLPRLSNMAGFALLPGIPSSVQVLLLSLAACAVLAAYAAYAATRRMPATLDVYAVLGLALVAGFLTWAASYHPHYGAFAGPFLALAVALPAGLLVPDITSFKPRPALAAGLAATVALVTVGVRQFDAESQLSAPTGLVAAADRLIPPGECVFTNDVSLTISANRFFSALPGCPEMVDSFGTLLAVTDGRQVSAPPWQVAKARSLVRRAFSFARFVWLVPGQIAWNGSLYRFFESHFRLLGLRGGGGNAAASTPANGLYAASHVEDAAPRDNIERWCGPDEDRA
jgi:alpha-1,2-mannosyltransferase